MASSRLDTFAIGEFFNKLIYDYKMLYPSEGLIAELLIMDFSWATMHAGKCLNSIEIQNINFIFLILIYLI